MQYHIQTNPIWDAFRSDTECPLCEIYDKVSARLVSQYLGEAVMEPDFRVRVNKLGFCDRHFSDLYAGENKLGLGLQINTRTDKVLDTLRIVDNVKAAKKLAETVDEMNSSCVICESADEMMERYAYTVAQMYAHETEFPALLRGCKGFCLPHFSLLLRLASHAGKAAPEYVKQLSCLQIEQMRRLNKETEWFTLKFDYRNAGKSWGNSKDAIPRGINKLRGAIVKNKDKA